jgi:hypothetical protein
LAVHFRGMAVSRQLERKESPTNSWRPHRHAAVTPIKYIIAFNLDMLVHSSRFTASSLAQNLYALALAHNLPTILATTSSFNWRIQGDALIDPQSTRIGGQLRLGDDASYFRIDS